ncbi:MAG: MucBP domain-containing protein, partial [Clostridia bacterium]|nr:MucBP domain-containing protein [Clostridia bacterium]
MKNSNRKRAELKTSSISVKKKVICLIGIVLLLGIALMFYLTKPRIKRDYAFLTPENMRAMEYGEFEDGDENISGTDNVTFIAYFPRDIDGDSYSEKMKGTCKEISQKDYLVMDMAVKDEGKVVNGKIEFEDSNISVSTRFPKDDILPQNYYSSGTKTIEFDEIPSGTQKTYIATIGCKSIRNESMFSQVNKVIFTGTYVAENGTEKQFRKEIPLTVDWYGTGEAGFEDRQQTYYDLPSRADEENQEVKVDIKITTEEKKLELVGIKNHVEGEIPEYNGYAPLKVECKSGNVAFDYNAETRKFTIDRETTAKNNEYNLRITYPLEAYKRSSEPRMALSIPVKTYYMLHNNPSEQFTNPYKTPLVQDTIEILYREPIPSPTYTPTPYEPMPIETYETESYTRCNIGFFDGTPFEYSLSKERAINEYQGVVGNIKDRFPEYWTLYVGTKSETTGAVFEQKSELGENYDSLQFVKSDGSYVSMEDCVTNVGIGFSSNTTHNITDYPEDDGWIKIYDADTDELVANFEYGSWVKYTDFNPYYYKAPVKHIRVETSFTCPDSYTSVINIKEIDDEYIAENITRNEFASYEYVRSDFKVTLSNGEEYWTHYQAPYNEPISDVELVCDSDHLSTQATNYDKKIHIKANDLKEFNYIGWMNASFLVKFPNNIADVQINNIEVDKDEIVIKNYELIDDENGRFIKIDTDNVNNKEQEYEITINCNISPDPRTRDSRADVHLYAANESMNNYSSYGHYEYSGMVHRSSSNTPDIYDVNNNLDISDYVGVTSSYFNLFVPNTLLMAQEACEYDDNNSTVVAPQVATIKPNLLNSNERTAKIKVSLQNNDIVLENGYDKARKISDIKVLGIIPFEGNKTLISNRDLKSSYTTQMLDGGITVPSDLQGLVTVYYSDNSHPSKDLSDASNNWKTNEQITDWSTIKTFLIDFNNKDLTDSKQYVFEYMIKIPNGVELNKYSYSGVGAYFCLNLESGKLKTSAETTALGFRMAEKYNLELSKYHIGEDILVPGATYRATKNNETAGKSGVTNTEGKLLFNDLLVGETYKIEEIKSPDEYILNGNRVEISSDYDNSTGEISFEKVSGETKGDISSTQTDGKYTMHMNVEDACKARLKIKKTDRASGEVLKGIKYIIKGRSFAEGGRKLTTDANGEIALGGLYTEEEYTLEEIKAKGYYISKPITFKIRYSGGNYDIDIIDNNNVSISEMGIKQCEMVIENGFPVASMELEDDKIPTYNLQITKVKRVTNVDILQNIQNGNTESITYLPGAMFRLYKDGKDVGSVTTNANGIATLEGLYQYESDRDVDQTYILKEVVAPDQYAKGKDITFKVEEESGSLVFKESTSGNQRPKQFLTNGNTINLIYEDSPSLKLTKKDGENGQVLANTKFVIYNVEKSNAPATNSKGEVLGSKEVINGIEYNVLTTDANGEITANLPEGIYRLNEVQTDEKYVLDTKDYYFGIGTSGKGRSGLIASYANVIGNDGEENINDTAGTSDGGYIAVGSFSGESLSLDGNVTLTGNNYMDGMIIKYNKSGSIDWTKTISGDSSASVTNVLVTPDDGFIVAVNHQGDLSFDGGATFDKTGENNNITLIKYNQSGEQEWIKEIMNSEDDSGLFINPKNIINTSDNGYIIIGETDCNTINVGDSIVLDNSNKSGIIVKCNNLGEPEWADIICKGNLDYVGNICEVSDGNYIVVGKTASYKGFVVKYDSVGEKQDEYTMGELLTDICKTDDGEYCISGYYNNDFEVNGDYVYDDGIAIFDSNDQCEKFIKTSRIKSLQAHDEGLYAVGFDNNYTGKAYIYSYSFDGSIETIDEITGVYDTDTDIALDVIPNNGCVVRINYNQEIDADLGNNVTIEKNTSGDYDGILIKYSTQNMIKPETRNLEGFGLDKSDNLSSISATNDGGYVVTGNFTMNSSVATAYDLYGDSYYNTIHENDDNDDNDSSPLQKLYLDEETYVINNPVIKYSGGRTIEWVNEIEGNLNNVISTSDDGCLVECYHWGRIGEENDYLSGQTIIKYGKDGELEWYRELGIPNFSSMTETKDEGYLVTGNISSRTNLGSGVVVRSNGGTDGIIIKYDKAGNILWANAVGSTEAEHMTGVCELPDGSFVVVGDYSSDSINLGNNIVLESDSDKRGMVLRYSSDGQIESAQAVDLGGESYSRFSSVTPSKDGGYVAAGYSSSSFDLGNDIRIDSGAFIVKYNNSNEVEWAKNIYGETMRYGNYVSCNLKVKQALSGDLLVYGMYNKSYSEDNDYLKIENTVLPMYRSDSYGSDTVIVLKYGQNGEFKWGDTIGSDYSNTHIADITEIRDGSVISVGEYSSNPLRKDSFSIRNSGEADGYTWEISPQITAEEMQELELYNYRKTYNVKTSVEEFDGVKGGSISGEDEKTYETIKHGDTSVKPIRVVPEENFKLVGITINGIDQQFVTEEDGSYTLPQLENVTENKDIKAKFLLKDNIITINKTDNETGEHLTGAEFKLDQIEERTSPVNEEVFGDLTDNSETFYEIDNRLTDEITGCIGGLTANGQESNIVRLITNSQTESALGTVQNNGTQYFVDNGNGSLIPTNGRTYQSSIGNSRGIRSSTANSYVKIDLSGMTGKYQVIVNAESSCDTYGDYGYATITSGTNAPSYSSSSGRFIYIYGKTSAKDYKSSYLEGGQVYYLHLGYRKDSSSDYYDDQVVFNSIKLYAIAESTESLSFAEEDGKYVSTNEYVDNSESSSYIPIDLTGYEGRYELIVDAEISSQSGDIGYATIKENTTKPTYNSSSGRFIYTSGTQSAREYSRVLQGGTMYYLHLGYYKDSDTSSGDDKFTINSVKLYKQTGKQYNFIENNGKFESTNQGKDNTTSRSYVPLDLTDYPGKYIVTVNAEISSDYNDYGYVTVTQNANGSYNYNERVLYICGNKEAQDYSLEITGGRMLYVNMFYRKGSSGSSDSDKFTINDISISLSDSELHHTTVKTNAFGKAITQIPFGKYILTEIEAPDGYELDEEPQEIEFRSNDGAQHEFTISNKKLSNVFVHHQKKGSIAKIADDEVLTGKSGDEYITLPVVGVEGFELEKDENGEEILPLNREGIFRNENQDVTYNYVQPDCKLIVHHYLDGTETKAPLKNGGVAEDIETTGDENSRYTTSSLSDDELDERYELVETPRNAEGVYAYPQTEVTYYYKEVEREITIHKTDVSTGEPLENVKFEIKRQGQSAEPEYYYILENMVQNGDYGFIKSNGKYIPTNGYTYQESKGNYEGIGNSVANSYIKVDLTQLEGNYVLKMNAYVSSESGYDYGYAAITDSDEAPTYDDDNNFICVSGDEGNTDYITDSLRGGIIYYLHLGYRKDGSSDGGEDQFVINDIALYSADGSTKVSDMGERHEKLQDVYYYTDSNGKIRMSFASGTYEIKELETLEGYVLDSETKTLVVNRNTENGNYEITNDKPKGKVTVHHYVQGTTEPIKRREVPVEDEIKTGYYGETFVTKPIDDILGYRVVSEPDETSGEYGEDDIVLTYYYEEVEVPATVQVHYFLEGTTTPVKDTEGNDIEDVILEGIVGNDYVTTEPANIAEYYELVSEPTNKSGLYIEELMEITYYYKLKNYNYSVEYYYDSIRDDNETETESAKYHSVITTYADKVKEGYTFDRDEGKPLTISSNEANNVIKVYYKKRTDLSYTVHYKEQGTETTLHEDKVIENQTFDDTVEESAIDIDGYDKVLPSTTNIHIVPGTNEYTFYYTKGKYSYTVEYYYDEVKDNDSTETIEATYLDEITTYTDKVKTGYKFDKVEGLPLTI